jgi:hypothetical protein
MLFSPTIGGSTFFLVFITFSFFLLNKRYVKTSSVWKTEYYWVYAVDKEYWKINCNVYEHSFDLFEQYIFNNISTCKSVFKLQLKMLNAFYIRPYVFLTFVVVLRYDALNTTTNRHILKDMIVIQKKNLFVKINQINYTSMCKVQVFHQTSIYNHKFNI